MNATKIVVLLLIYATYLTAVALAGRGGRGGKGSRSYSKGLGRSKSRSLSRSRSGLSGAKKAAIFATAGGLAGIYIGSQLGSRNRFSSYNDFRDYTICPGRHRNIDGGRTYPYFACPDSPFERSLRYCCVDAFDRGYCCGAPSRRSFGRNGIIGTVLTIMGFIGIGAVVYYCCCRRRRQETTDGDLSAPSPGAVNLMAPEFQPKPPGPTFTSHPGGATPYPPYMQVASNAPPYPPAASSQFPGSGWDSNPPYPVPPATGPAAVGSGWGGGLSNEPPPPYPG